MICSCDAVDASRGKQPVIPHRRISRCPTSALSAEGCSALSSSSRILPLQPEHLTLFHRERHAVDGVHVSHRSREQPFLIGNALEIRELENRGLRLSFDGFDGRRHRIERARSDLARAPAPRQMIVDDNFEWRILQALLDHHRTTRVEAATCRESRRVGNRPRNDAQPIDHLAELRQRRLQPGVVGMQRLRKAARTSAYSTICPPYITATRLPSLPTPEIVRYENHRLPSRAAALSKLENLR